MKRVMMRPMGGARLLLVMFLSGCAGGGTLPTPPPAPVTVLALKGEHNQAVVEALARQSYLEVKTEDPLALLSSRAASEGAPSRSAAGPETDAARVRLEAALQRARKAYRELRFTGALKVINQEQAAILIRLRTRAEVLLLAELQLNAGLNLLALKRREQADHAFSTAFVLGYKGPTAGQYAPEVEAALRESRESLTRATRGELMFNISPAGGVVLLDGQRLNGSPLRVKGRPGLHLVRVEAAGHLPQVFFQRVSAGKLERLEITLKPVGQAALAADLLRRRPRGVGLVEESPAVVGRVLGWHKALLEMDGAASELQGMILWTGEAAGKGRQERCQGATHQGLSDCFGPLLYQLATGTSLPSARGERSSIFRRWWFWTAVGAAVAGGAATAIYFGTRDTSGTDIDLQFAR